MSSTGDDSPARNNGFAQILSKARRGHNKKPGDSHSFVSDSSDGLSALKSSIEGAIERLKSHDDDSDEVGGLSKLLGNRTRRKKQEQAAEEAARGRTIADRGTLDNKGDSTIVVDDASSQLTYESEDES